MEKNLNDHGQRSRQRGQVQWQRLLSARICMSDVTVDRSGMKSGSRLDSLEKRDQIADNIDDTQEIPWRFDPVTVITDEDEVSNQVHNEFQND